MKLTFKINIKNILFALLIIANQATVVFPQTKISSKKVILYLPINYDFKDESGNNYEFEILGNTTFAKNINGTDSTALRFDKSRAAATLRSESVYLPEFSVSFWFKSDKVLDSNSAKIPLTFVSNNLFDLGYSSGQLIFQLNGETTINKKIVKDPNATFSIDTNFKANEWYFLNFNCKQSKIASFTINEKQDMSFEPLINRHQKLTPTLYFGADKNMKNFFNGLIDEFQFSNRIKSESELDSMYNSFKYYASPKKTPKINIKSPQIITTQVIQQETTSKININEKRIALVIGNSNYPTSPLKNPVNDSKAIEIELTKLGFEVDLKLNASQIDIKRAISEFGTKLATDNSAVGLFYYAGHGMQVRGKNYLVPIDAKVDKEPDVEVYCVDLDGLLSNIEYAGNSMNIIILDACRNNPFARSFRSTAGTGLASIRAPKGTFIGFATAPGSVASDGTGANGLYTQEFIKALQIPNLKIEDVFKKVRLGVSMLSNDQQLPWDNSSLVGDFYFRTN